MYRLAFQDTRTILNVFRYDLYVRNPLRLTFLIESWDVINGEFLCK